MTDTPLPSAFDQTVQRVETILSEKGFKFLQADTMRPLLEHEGLTDWDTFASSWNDLGLDLYMADGGRYRRRRYATFSVSNGLITRKTHQPHYQSRDHNLLNGGIERWFGAIEDNIASHPAMIAAIRTISRFADALTPCQEKPETWHTEVHQFRIEANPDSEGRPTPEGMHRDGVDWVLVLMIGRHNVEQGVTTIHDNQKDLLGSFTLTQPLDAAIVDDHRVYHGVTAVTPQNPNEPAYRDVLVITLRHE
ncbi:2OG-Fe dioxygenase family protein [Gluconobacter japonicus]|uniref:2OG-Fe dioxygenase family protein n=1 Tax=Gluconobacter japonicus TaxID=376620 RepID=UPI0024AE0FFA|nr:2OG-Fe dioxygenase family protein [Gluconobacter japonicus]MDI6651536.1 2OG-Fe dioxygenase family protein [Gluconobacter japonicus]